MKTSIRFARLLAACAGLLAVRALAQDIIVSDSVWLFPEAAPDAPPKTRDRLRPDYPDEMSNTSEVGYVVVTRFVDEEGTNQITNVSGTHLPFQRAVEKERKDWSYAAPKREGHPVGAWLGITVIFNPKNASTKGPDAVPRLLAVAPAMTPERPTPAGFPAVISMRLSVDASGAIVQSVPEGELKVKEKEKTLAAIREALRSWRFAPARQNGQPVAAEIVVPVLCQPPLKPDAGKFVPPRVIDRERPEYPIAMRRFGMRGEVDIGFQVDTDGHVQNPTIITSSNPAFDEPALDSIRRWKFAPGTRDGKPVKVNQRVPIVFDLVRGGEDAFHIKVESDQSRLPPELRYDTPPKIRGVLVPVYPDALWRAKETGKAKVNLMIDQRGRVIAVEVLEATKPEFGLALTAAIEGFSFDPALKDGKPVPHLLTYEQQFNFRELPDERGAAAISLEKRHPEKIVSAAGLDTPLKPVARHVPIFPVNLLDKLTHGDALVEVVVDEDGHVRLPRIVSASGEAFGYAAVQSAVSWIFDPPTVGGKTVNVRVQIPFVFNVKGPKPAAPAPDAPPPAETK